MAKFSPSVKIICRLVDEIRQGLKTIVRVEPDEQQYLLALLHYAMRYLTYPDISIPKKVFAIGYIGALLDSISPKDNPKSSEIKNNETQRPSSARCVIL